MFPQNYCFFPPNSASVAAALLPNPFVPRSHDAQRSLNLLDRVRFRPRLASYPREFRPDAVGGLIERINHGRLSAQHCAICASLCHSV